MSDFVIPFDVAVSRLCDQARVDLTAAKLTASSLTAKVIPIRSRQHEVELENLILRQRNIRLESLLEVADANASRVFDELQRRYPNISWCSNVLNGDINLPSRRW